MLELQASLQGAKDKCDGTERELTSSREHAQKCQSEVAELAAKLADVEARLDTSWKELEDARL